MFINVSYGSQSYFMKNTTYMTDKTLIGYILNDKKFAPALSLSNSLDRHREHEILDVKQKNPYLALFIAVVPGSIIHGLGHAYIERSKTFKILFITELVSIPVAYFSAVMAYGDAMSEGSQFPLAVPAGMIAVVAFFGTWIYDIIAAPLLARELIIEKSSGFKFAQQFDFNRKTVSMNIVFCF